MSSIDATKYNTGRIPDSVYASEILNEYREKELKIVTSHWGEPTMCDEQKIRDEKASVSQKESVDELGGYRVIPRDPLAFTTLKWVSALSPVYIPFILLFIVTGGDIALSILFTFAFDVLLFSAVLVYVIRKGDKWVDR